MWNLHQALIMACLVFSFGKLKSITVLNALHTYIKIKTPAAQFTTPQAEEAIAQTNSSGMSSHHNPKLHTSLTLVFT